MLGRAAVINAVYERIERIGSSQEAARILIGAEKSRTNQ
jgi:hypothetical protein